MRFNPVKYQKHRNVFCGEIGELVISWLEYCILYTAKTGNDKPPVEEVNAFNAKLNRKMERYVHFLEKVGYAKEVE